MATLDRMELFFIRSITAKYIVDKVKLEKEHAQN